MKRLILIAIIGGLGLLAITIFAITPANMDHQLNGITPHEAYEISDEAQKLHDTLIIADLHNDLLLWRRNPLYWQERGHSDIPRLRKGNVTLQVLSATTSSPHDLNYESNDDATDKITKLNIIQGWPIATWRSVFKRAEYHIERLEKMVRRDKNIYFVRTRADLENLLIQKSDNKASIGMVMTLEGANALEGKSENFDLLYEKGLRIIGLTHFFDNEVAGSFYGEESYGLTKLGREIIKKANKKSIMIDVAHTSETAIRETLALSTKPIFISHTGIQSICPTKRNTPDSLLVEIARKGGIIGIGFWEDIICDTTPLGIANSIKAAVELVGIDHVALGSDFDGAVLMPLDASELAALTQALLDIGMDEASIRKVMGENQIRFFLENLPVAP